MDDNTQVPVPDQPNVKPEEATPMQTANRPVQAPSAPPTVPTQAASTAVQGGTPTGKEQEPIAAPKVDVAKMTESEIIREEKAVERELEAIIEETPSDEKPDIPQEAKNAGLELAKDAIPMPTSPSTNIVLPMTYEEAEATKKRTKIKDSLNWMAALIAYHWKKINFSSKKE